LGVFTPGALHPVTAAPIKALACLCFFPPMAEKSKPPALRAAGGSNLFQVGYKLQFLNRA